MRGPTRSGWSWLTVLAPAGTGALFAGLAAAFGPDPVVLVLAAVPLGVAAAAWRLPRRAGPVTVLIESVLFLLLNAPVLADSLLHPESTHGFLITLVPLVLSLLGVVAAIGVLRSWDHAAAPRVAVATVAVLAVGAGASLVFRTGITDDAAVAGDSIVVTERARFLPTRILVPAGGVGILVDNLDPLRHTFTIDALGVDVELPSLTARRIVFDAPAGTYEFVCAVTGHDQMRGTLVVEG